jgi:hypothetical protein
LGETSVKQLKISLPEELRAQLDQASAASGVSVAEEIRRRIEASFEQDGIDPATRELQDYIVRLAVMVRLQTNHLDWFIHPGAHRSFRFGITSRLARLKPEGEPVFGPDDLPKVKLVEAESPEAVGQALESIDHHTPPLDPEKLRILREQTLKEMIQRYPDLIKGGKQS